MLSSPHQPYFLKSISLYVCIIVLFIIVIITIFPISPNLPVPVEHVFRGGTFLVLRFPYSHLVRQEEISITKSSSFTGFTRYLIDERPRRLATSGDLSETDIQQLGLFSSEWCHIPLAVQEHIDKPVYELGLRCDVNASNIRVFKISVDDLPFILKTLILAAPSPTCDDPFCGWNKP
jgi:hypothetical protein